MDPSYVHVHTFSWPMKFDRRFHRISDCFCSFFFQFWYVLGWYEQTIVDPEWVPIFYIFSDSYNFWRHARRMYMLWVNSGIFVTAAIAFWEKRPPKLFQVSESYRAVPLRLRSFSVHPFFTHSFRLWTAMSPRWICLDATTVSYMLFWRLPFFNPSIVLSILRIQSKRTSPNGKTLLCG